MEQKGALSEKPKSALAGVVVPQQKAPHVVTVGASLPQADWGVHLCTKQAFCIGRASIKHKSIWPLKKRITTDKGLSPNELTSQHNELLDLSDFIRTYLRLTAFFGLKAKKAGATLDCTEKCRDSGHWHPDRLIIKQKADNSPPKKSGRRRALTHPPAHADGDYTGNV